jgi:hypothetical protein
VRPFFHRNIEQCNWRASRFVRDPNISTH